MHSCKKPHFLHVLKADTAQLERAHCESRKAKRIHHEDTKHTKRESEGALPQTPPESTCAPRTP
ncbi:MAG: hypothetical protein KAI66_11905, partial [Lentisphaeria bacterium]|nr:hypothetical protein [Lentisphaeria bacterium]